MRGGNASNVEGLIGLQSGKLQTIRKGTGEVLELRTLCTTRLLLQSYLGYASRSFSGIAVGSDFGMPDGRDLDRTFGRPLASHQKHMSERSGAP